MFLICSNVIADVWNSGVSRHIINNIWMLLSFSACHRYFNDVLICKRGDVSLLFREFAGFLSVMHRVDIYL
jgi:hypothetical protein